MSPTKATKKSAAGANSGAQRVSPGKPGAGSGTLVRGGAGGAASSGEKKASANRAQTRAQARVERAPGAPGSPHGGQRAGQRTGPAIAPGAGARSESTAKLDAAEKALGLEKLGVAEKVGTPEKAQAVDKPGATDVDARGSAREQNKAGAERLAGDKPSAERAAGDKTGAERPAGADRASSAEAERPSQVPEGEGRADGKKDRPPSAVQTLALELVSAGDVQAVLRHLSGLDDERETVANQAARLVQELAEIKPELLVSMIERFGKLLVSKNKRVVASSAAALAPLSRIAPAKVAKQLPVLTQHWELTTEEGKDGLVRTFAGLCTASVAYQKRLEPALAKALGEADPKLLIRWTEVVLPALKGEPHARARAVVEERLPNIPRPQAQKIADFLGIKLRPLPR